MTVILSMMTFFLVLQVLNRLGRLERRMNGLPELSENVKRLADDPQQKILAIKQLRNETGCGLAEAKEAVEAYIRSQQS
jgi:ribosomal protein L7/L12